MVPNGYTNGTNGQNGDVRPTYALEHLATFKLKSNAETLRPKDKLKTLIELDKTGGVWPMKMYLSFNGQWLVILDSDMKEIENFPGRMITEPTAFITEDPSEVFNNILIFSVPGIALGMTDMHIFQVVDVSAIHLVEDLKAFSAGKQITIDRNKTPIELPKPERPAHDQYGIAVAAAEVAAEKNVQDEEQTLKDVNVLNHCFEDIERFVSRLQFAADALRELEERKHEHSMHGEGILQRRAIPPSDVEFQDIFAKHKLAFNFVKKLQIHFQDPGEPIHNLFTSLQSIYFVSKDVYGSLDLAENVVDPLLQRDAVALMKSHVTDKENNFWQSLGPNWLKSKDQFIDHRGAFAPIFYDEWSPDWVVDEEVPYVPPPSILKKAANGSPGGYNATWLTRLQSRNVKIAEVSYNKIANNDRELNVSRGEYLEIIDDSRNWWKARNAAGSVGYVPHTILVPYNFEVNSNASMKDTDSICSSIVENGHDQVQQDIVKRKTLTGFIPPTEQELQAYQAKRNSMPRSISMPNVPVPPPMPPPSEPGTPSGTLTRNAIVGGLAALRPRNDNDNQEDAAFVLQSTVNDELRLILQQRERRKDMEILVTPQIYISQQSSPKEVEDWLRGKGFSDIIVKKLRNLNGEELFALKPHAIEGYFGQKESRRLISQIVLQRNICEYKTVRSSELNAKLAKARQKVEKPAYNPDEVF